MEAVTPHLFALPRPRTVGDSRKEKGEKERESLGFNLHSILIPIRYRGFPFLWFTSYTGSTGTICTAKEGVFRGSTPMHTDVASSSIKYRTINNLPSRWYTSLSILAMRADSSPLSDRLPQGNRKAFRLFVSITVSQWTRRNSLTTKVPARREVREGRSFHPEIRNYRSDFYRGADSRNMLR